MKKRKNHYHFKYCSSADRSEAVSGIESGGVILSVAKDLKREVTYEIQKR